MFGKSSTGRHSQIPITKIHKHVESNSKEKDVTLKSYITKSKSTFFKLNQKQHHKSLSETTYNLEHNTGILSNAVSSKNVNQEIIPNNSNRLLSKPPQRQIQAYNINTAPQRKPLILTKKEPVNSQRNIVKKCLKNDTILSNESFNNENLNDILNCENSKDLDLKSKSKFNIGSSYTNSRVASRTSMFNHPDSIDHNIKRSSIYSGAVRVLNKPTKKVLIYH
jgi:hypothetical protein